MLVAGVLDHVGDRNDGERRTHAEPRRSQSGGESAPPGEPLDRIPDTRAVHGPGTNTADDPGEIKHPKRAREGHEQPGEEDEDPTAHDHPPRAELIDQPPLRGYQPRLEQHEESEGDLDSRLAPSELLANRPDEERPAVLVVGDHDHAYEAD